MSPTGACGSSLVWGMQYDNGAKVERESARAAESSSLSPHPSIYNPIYLYLSLYATVFPFSQPSSSQPCPHCNYLVGHFSVHGRTCCMVYLPSLCWEALDRAGGRSYLTRWDSPGVHGLLGEGKTIASSSPIAEWEDVALLIRETEWLYLLHSSPLAVNQGN